MAEMTQSDIEAFLNAPRHAILATSRTDGSPQLSPVWYLYEDRCLYISVLAHSAKLKNLRRDPRLGFCVDGGPEDVRTVMMYGQAEILETDHPQETEMKWRITRHYHETEAEARQYAEATRHHKSALLIVQPHTLISQEFN
jgi:PPOX class probable F420-dependent enzyme